MSEIDFSDWPKSAEKGRKLPHQGIGAKDAASLRKKGWNPIDVRGMPSGSLEERGEAVLAYFEGVRLGTIPPPDARQVRCLELEARACGLHVLNKGAPEKEDILDKDDLDLVLNLPRRERWSEGQDK